MIGICLSMLGDLDQVENGQQFRKLIFPEIGVY